MTRQEILTQLRRAKSAHLQWRAYAQALIAGVPMQQEQVPLAHTACAFGKWYYGEGQALAGLATYPGIEAPHETLHRIYLEIFKLLFSDQERSLLSRLFGKASAQREKNRHQAEALMTQLLGVSTTMLDALAQLEKEVMETPDQELARLF